MPTLEPTKHKDQFPHANSEKIRLFLAAMADKYNERVRTMILRTYEDHDLLSYYHAIRQQHAIDRQLGKKSIGRRYISFPNGYVFDFVDTVMRAKYGEDWLSNDKTFFKACRKEDLIKPWLLVSKV